ncbi:DNA topoisomerase III [Alkalihalobacterium alkalinitrilicum]|uniref:DNA topoisomerase III n=1 Tax=Alkalihalobacterium alkalinitrilicum TaxID=427920 RepID=UPI000994F98C|nr:DNA topoisomerase III [Alkalihalobacterium alkalinitrilicum]
MELIIAEKPDQGLKLASPFQYKRRDGYIEIAPNPIFKQGAYCTWAVGHLTELCPPEFYKQDWKAWAIQTLPIIPEKFQYKVTKSKYKQFNIVKQLLKNNEVTRIIHAGDAGREGELIVRNIIQLSGVKKPMKRLWISSLTNKAIMDGFTNLLDESDTRTTYFEAYSRACADWLVGMNASRVYTLLLQQKGISDVFSLGRVQTPTLALIVKREKEIHNFKSKPFWEVMATFSFNGKTYRGKWHKNGETRLDEEAMAEKIRQFCDGKEALVQSAEKERKEYHPPFLFNLSALQATANSLYKFSPQKTLEVAQKLYVKGIISYPRSDSSHVTKEEAKTFPEILEKLKNFEDLKPFFPVPMPSIMNNKRYVNEKKVSDHYAIIPTEQVPLIAKLNPDEQKIYTLIAKRLIAAHYDQAIFDYTTIHTVVDNRATFISKGKQQIQEGWRKVIYSEQKKQKQDEDEQDLPLVHEQEQGKVKDVKVKEGKTEPPKRYTEGQLITLMKTAGKHLDDSELVKVLKQTEGLGTEATRAGIIKSLKDRKYIDVKKNQVSATNKGILLIDSIGNSLLSSPEMTAKWEQRLHEIGEGTASPSDFMNQVKKLSTKLIDDAKLQSESWNFTGYNLEEFKRQRRKGMKSRKSLSTGTKIGPCKKCNEDVVDKGTFYGCSNYTATKCSFTISKKVLGKTVSQTNVKKLLKGEESNVIKGFKKGDKTFDAKLALVEGKLKFVYSNREN